jgi:hypothetical protein
MFITGLTCSNYFSGQFEKYNVLGTEVHYAELCGQVATGKLNAFESLSQIHEMLSAFEVLHGIDNC